MIFKMKDMFDEYPNPIYIVRPIISGGVSDDFEYIYVNTAFCLFLGLSKEELTGHRFREYFSAGERPWFDAFVRAAAGRKHFFVDTVSTLISKKIYTEMFHIDPDMCGCIIHNYRDISENPDSDDDEIVKQAITKIKADRDCLTGFYSRFHLSESLNELSRKVNVGITYLDINRLKDINADKGRAAGDETIKRIAEMMRSHYKSSMIFRVSGDEFVIITENISSAGFAELSRRAEKLFGIDSLASIGYRHYEKIDNLHNCIKRCRALICG